MTVFEGTVQITIGDEEKSSDRGRLRSRTPAASCSARRSSSRRWRRVQWKLKTPNHKMAPISLSPTLGGVCGTATCRVVAVTSSEPENGTGDGRHVARLVVRVRDCRCPCAPNGSPPDPAASTRSRSSARTTAVASSGGRSRWWFRTSASGPAGCAGAVQDPCWTHGSFRRIAPESRDLRRARRQDHRTARGRRQPR